MKKRELEDWEKAECLALKAAVDAFNAGKPRAETLTQGKIADALGINQGSVSSYLNGYNALNTKVASVMSGLISKPVEEFSPRLAADIAKMVAVHGDIDYQKDDRYHQASPEHRVAVDEMASRMLGMSEEQALKLKQAMDLLMPNNDRRQD
jgi:transcriptional regulator with XRE-family HTH domain